MYAKRTLCTSRTNKFKSFTLEKCIGLNNTEISWDIYENLRNILIDEDLQIRPERQFEHNPVN